MTNCEQPLVFQNTTVIPSIQSCASLGKHRLPYIRFCAINTSCTSSTVPFTAEPNVLMLFINGLELQDKIRLLA